MRRTLAALVAAVTLLVGVGGVTVDALTLRPSLYPESADGSPSDPMNTGSAVCVGTTWTSAPLGLIGVSNDLSADPDIDFAPGESVTAVVVGAWMDPDVGTISVVGDDPSATFVMPTGWPPDAWNSIYGEVLTPGFFRIRLDATEARDGVDFGAVIRFDGESGSTAELLIRGSGSDINVETPEVAEARGHPEVCAGVAPPPKPTRRIPLPATSTVTLDRSDGADPTIVIALAIVAIVSAAAGHALIAGRRGVGVAGLADAADSDSAAGKGV